MGLIPGGHLHDGENLRRRRRTSGQMAGGRPGGWYAMETMVRVERWRLLSTDLNAAQSSNREFTENAEISSWWSVGAEREGVGVGGQESGLDQVKF